MEQMKRRDPRQRSRFSVEIEIPALRQLAVETRQAREFVEEFTMSDGRRLYLLADGPSDQPRGRGGHPALVMDMSFANQALAAEYAIANASELERRVYPVPDEIDREIARLKLATMGIEIDRLTEEQAKYLASWDEGTPQLEEIVHLEDDAVVLLDQRRLPDEVVEVRCRSAAEVADAIRGMAIRARPRPASRPRTASRFRGAAREEVDAAAATLLASRPTARNLAWALEQLRADPSAEQARALHAEEVEPVPAHERACRKSSSPAACSRTRCNAGARHREGYGERGRRDPPRLRARPDPPRLGRRDEAAATGFAADGVGARAARRRPRRDPGRCRRVPDGRRRGRCGGHGRRPDRGERRHGEQDRHVRARGHTRHHGIHSWWSRRPPPSTRRRRTGPRSRSRNGRGGGVDPVPCPQPGLRRPPGGGQFAAIVAEDGIHRAPYAFTLRVEPVPGVNARSSSRAEYATQLWPPAHGGDREAPPPARGATGRVHPGRRRRRGR